MTEPAHQPTHQPSSTSDPTCAHPAHAPLAGLNGVNGFMRSLRGTSSDPHPLSPAHARHTNARRASYAAAALQHHAHLSNSRPDSLQTALTELLTDIHHLYDTCDVDTDLATLFKVAALIHTRETQPS